MRFSTLPFKGLLNKEVTLKKPIATDLDTKWGEKSYSYDTYTIKAHITPVTEKDLYFLESGIATVGDVVGIFFPSYTINDQTVEVDTEDRIVVDGIEYRVDAIRGFDWFGLKVKIAVMRRPE